MKNNMSLETLKGHLFETLEGLKNLNDPEASDCEKMQIDQAKAIVEVSDSILDIYKLQVDAVKTFIRKDDLIQPNAMLQDMGITDKQNIKLIQ